MHTDAPITLIQLAPPGDGGVSDYLHCLQAEWARNNMPSKVISLSKELAAERSLVERVGDCTDQPSSCVFILHFSGYGFGRRGLCFWLLDELKRLRATHSNVRLIVVFHELFATGEPPWRSAFWLSRLQAQIATRLARMADALWTNTEQHARWLRYTVGPAIPVHLQPVFSNVGEPHAPPKIAARAPQAVVLGSPSTRQRAFDALQGRTASLRRLGIEQLVEVGSGGPSRLPADSISTQYTGHLECGEINHLLQLSRFGVLDYPTQFLGKSGVFAAYAAHGCAVLDTCASGPDTDGLVAGREYLIVPALTDTPLSADSLDARAARLLRWYADHRLPRQARELLALAKQR